jgi:hypothetical protein
MMRVWKRGWRELIVLLAALACAGSWATGQVRSMRDRSEVAKMTEKIKTVCVGRYLVDVPADAEVSLSGGMLDGFDIETKEESEVVFQQRLAARENEIGTHQADNTNKEHAGMVEARDLRIPGMVGRIFIFDRSRGYLMEGDRRVDMESVSVEAHAHMGGISILLSATSTDEAAASAAEALLTRLQLRGADEIPDVPGFCIRRGLFVEPLPAHKNEHIVMHVGVPRHPDLAMVLFSIAGGKSESGLLERVAHTDAISGADELLRVSKLRSDKRSINGLDGEEVVERVREYNFTTGYAFNWETQGVTDDVLRPYLSLELQTGISEHPGGKPTDTSLHEDALLALWDSIASSIRLRKNDSPVPSDPPREPSGPSGPKLGTVASAGDLCPQSGWWQCSAGGPELEVHGGQVQYLRKGERMPQALLLPRQNLWQKMRRVQPSMESAQPTAWKLLDKRQRPRMPVGVSLAQPGAPGVDSGAAMAGIRPVAVGTYARTGDVCPASGWWRCEDAQALDGARWFARGSVLPVATFQVPTGVFARPGGPAFIQRRSAWQLVRQVDAPAATQAAPPLPGGPPLGESPASA